MDGWMVGWVGGWVDYYCIIGLDSRSRDVGGKSLASLKMLIINYDFFFNIFFFLVFFCDLPFKPICRFHFPAVHTNV